MNINITDAQVQGWIQDGIRVAINSMMRESYGTGASLRKAMDKAVAESEVQVTSAIKAGINQACMSPEFLQSIEREIASTFARQYRGIFDGVVRAAAKQAANGEGTADRMAKLAQRAAGREPASPAVSSEGKEELRRAVSALVRELNALGFASPEKPVNGADAIDLISQWLPRLRELAG